MKINVEFDLTPDEFRRSLGLPDVEAFQKDLLDRIYRQMESGAEGYDPMSLMKPFLQQQGIGQGLSQGLSKGLANFGTYQQMMLDMLSNAASSSRSSSNADEKQKDDKDSDSKAGSAKSSNADSTSARSRSSDKKASDEKASGEKSAGKKSSRDTGKS